jgi:SM-20-related protein
MMNLSLDPTLQLNDARTVFRRQGRVFLPAFLQASGVHQLAQRLSSDLPFHVTMNKVDASVAKVAEAELARAGEDFQRRLMTAVYGASVTGFRYFYSQFEFDQHLQESSAVGELSREVWAFLQSAPFLTAIGRIIGVPDLQRASGQASRYAPGHFLTRHDDDVPNSGRRAAFVLYLSAEWQADWGGLLQFIDRDGHVAEAYTPTFNSLALFRVPSSHSVSMVTPLAPIPRLAISGWVH